jgi:hypothetical protein
MFAEELLSAWREWEGDEIAEVIISEDRRDASFKIHVVRSGEKLIGDDLEGFIQGVLVVNSSYDGRLLHK